MPEHKQEVADLLKHNGERIPASGFTFTGSAYAEALYNCTVDGVVGFDKNFRVTVWNRNMELHYSIPQSEAVGEKVNELVPELGTVFMLREVLAGKNIFLKDNPYKHRDGFFQAYISPVKDISGKILGGIAVIHDNTEIKQALDKIRKQNEELLARNEALKKEIEIRERAEEELKKAHDSLEERVKLRTQQLSETNRELNEFAYVISHDLKAPLRGISSLSEWIATDYAHLLDDSGRKSMDLLRNSVRRMDQLIRGVLNYYRMSKSAELTQVNTASLVNEIIRQLRPNNNIHIVTGDLPDIYTEEVPFYQVIQNLIDNAIKYNDKARGRIEISCRREGKEYIFSVSDNGKGIPEDDRERVFMLFQTGCGACEKESTGIGLAVVKKIVTRLGGRIWLESKQGKGSCFYFSIPDKS